MNELLSFFYVVKVCFMYNYGIEMFFKLICSLRGLMSFIVVGIIVL